MVIGFVDKDVLRRSVGGMVSVHRGRQRDIRSTLFVGVFCF